MNARQARNKTVLIKDKLSTGHIYHKCIEAVTKAVNKGELSTWFYQQISEETKSVLVNDGYVLSEESFYRNEYLIKISW